MLTKHRKMSFDMNASLQSPARPENAYSTRRHAGQEQHLQALYELVHDSQQARLLAQGALVGHQHALAVDDAAALNLLQVVLAQCHSRAHLHSMLSNSGCVGLVATDSQDFIVLLKFAGSIEGVVQ